ncbi:MAG: lipopolysaccharide biosynthesis protein [Oscillospiraceae bacterium]
MLQKQNKYSRLVTNTLLLGISSFSSKILSVLLTRLYTTVLGVAAYGSKETLEQTANVLIPLMGLGIAQAVIRFGLDKDIPADNVFTNGLVTILLGLTGIVLVSPIFSLIPHLQNEILLMIVYMFTSCLRLLCCQFVRSQMRIRLYAIDGILASLYTVGFNMLYLVYFKMGTTGYFLSIISADLASTLGLFIVMGLWRYINFKQFNKPLFLQMLRYSLPLVPSTISWWLVSTSDRFFITYIVGQSATGLYGVAAKPSGIVSVISTFFTEAWQISAVTDGQDEDKGAFFSTVYAAVMAVAFIIGGGLIFFCQLAVRLLSGNAEYYEAWRYVPFLAISSVFTFLQSFMSSVFVVEKKSTLTLYSVLIGAGTSLALNSVLIPILGLYGAGIANMSSSMVIFVVRAIMARRFITMRYQPVKLLINTALILAETMVMILRPWGWIAWCGLALMGLIGLNVKELVVAAQHVFFAKKKHEKESKL